MEIDKIEKRFPGFKFSPTEQELILYYLKRKLEGFQKCVQVIAEIDINQHEPWDLPEKSVIWSKNEWFFFCTSGKKYSKGSQSKRTTEAGYWKATGRKLNVKSGRTRVIGAKRTLVFHKGRPPKGKRTEWIMHEYCMSGAPQESLVICRVRRMGQFNDDILPKQLNQSGESSDLPQKDVVDEPTDNNVENMNTDMFQGFTDGCNDSESENVQFQDYGSATDDCFADILEDDIIKLHGSSLSSYADVLKNDRVNDNFIDDQSKQPTEGVPLATPPFHETENRGIIIRQRQQRTPRAPLPFQGTANRRIRLNWQHKNEPKDPVEASSVGDNVYCIVADSAEFSRQLITTVLDVAVNYSRVMVCLVLVLLVLCFWVPI